jgi:hypothetical protein
MLGLTLSAGAAASLTNPAQAIDPPGAKAAQVYCFMRSNGNNHEVSWAAAYGVVKQTSGVFKPPPERAAGHRDVLFAVHSRLGELQVIPAPRRDTQALFVRSPDCMRFRSFLRS